MIHWVCIIGSLHKKIFQRMSNLFSRLFCSNSIFLVINFRCRNRFKGHFYFFRERAFGFTENWWFGWWRGWKVWETEYDEKSAFSILTEFKERKICNVFDASFLLWKNAFVCDSVSNNSVFKNNSIFLSLKVYSSISL